MNKTIKSVSIAFAAALLLTSCGSDAPRNSANAGGGGGKDTSQGGTKSDDGSSKNKPKSPTNNKAAFEGQVVEVEVSNGDVSVTPEEVSVATGDKLRIEVLSDVADEVHVHGYDVMTDVGPGRRARLDLTADIPGVFEVELERSGAALFELTVQ